MRAPAATPSRVAGRRSWGARLARVALIAAPFLLLAVGTWALVSSPWPAILGLMVRGQHVRVVWGWRTAGLGALAAGAYLAALAISYTIRREPR